MDILFPVAPLHELLGEATDRAMEAANRIRS
jgi:hypothetical protein